MSRYAVIKLKLVAKIGNYLFDDVLQYTAAFALNSIPAGTLVVAVGTNVQTQQLATIHKAKNDLDIQLKVEVFLKPVFSSVEKADTGLPGYDAADTGLGFKIFEGRIVGTGWRRTESGAQFIIHLLHWVGDLNYASAASASSHPGNPANMTYPAVFGAVGGSTSTPKTGADGRTSWIPTVSSDLVSPANLSDIWGKILHPWMQSISADDPLDEAMRGDGTSNDIILAALARMGVNGDGQPLELDLAEAPTNLDLAFRLALMNETGNNWINTTLWGKLIGEWAPAYLFSVVPRVDDVLIVPFTGGLQGEPWAVIGSEDYSQCDLNAQLKQVLRGVGIVHPIMFATGVNAGLPSIRLDTGGVAGFYQPENLNHGLILLKDAPKWLSDSNLNFFNAVKAEGIDGNDVTTAVDEQGLPSDEAIHNPDSNAIKLSGLLDLYARQWYILESLKGRVGEISGKLRFDIAPGSNVLVQASGARNVVDQFQLQNDIYATVTQVAYVINAESQRAGTSFSLAHIRSEVENTQPGTSIDKPPLYTTAWRGAVLVKHGDIKPEKKFQG